MGNTTSDPEIPRESGIIVAKVCSTVERWLYNTPLGLPVVPEV
jgi:hypothetical protein